MDPRLLGYYNQELKFVREMGAEFAAAYPRIAARLGLEGDVECADPYVERLIEAVAFLTARVQLKLDARHPEFTQHLLELIYPHFVAPVPSCGIVEFIPDPKEGSLLTGLRLARGTTLRPPLAKGARTACEFRTAHEVTLWPIGVTEARYVTGAGALAALGVGGQPRARAAIRLRLKCAGGIHFSALPLERLVFHIKAGGDIAARIYEQVMANGLAVGARALDSRAGLQYCPTGSIREVGFSDLEAMLPATRRSFAGYRLLQEYFALPERYLFFALSDLREVLRGCDAEQCELFILLDRPQAALENQLEASQFRLGCTPVINLFPRSVDRIQLHPFDTEHHLIPDRNRPQDFEIYSIDRMSGIGAAGEASIPVAPFYGVDHRSGPAAGQLYYTLQRRLRLPSARQQQSGSRSSYAGTECFVSLAGDPALQQQLRQLDAHALCTNRDLPIQIALGSARSDFLVEGGAPVESVRCITGPTYPRPSSAFGDTAWKLISHLSLNYMSLLDDGVSEGAGLLRDMLSLYSDPANPAVVRQIEGLRGIAHDAVVRRLPLPGPISHGRGLRISLTVEEAAFEGTGALLLASVLERFFAAYVSINSFTQTRVVSSTRGEIKEWPARLGTRPLM
jgi:type VI secretion system protein ImpG